MFVGYEILYSNFYYKIFFVRDVLLISFTVKDLLLNWSGRGTPEITEIP